MSSADSPPHTELLRPPRALYVPFPFGMPLGHPEDPAQQRRVLAALFALLDRPAPVLLDLTGEATVDEPASPVQASMVAVPALRSSAAKRTNCAQYVEARFVMRPDDSTGDIARWLWAGTALGPVLVRVAGQLAASGDATERAAATGISR